MGQAKNEGTKVTFYRYLAERMWEHADLGVGRISPSAAREVLGWYRIPKTLRMKMFQEMRGLGLIKWESKNSFKIKIRPKPLDDVLGSEQL